MFDNANYVRAHAEEQRHTPSKTVSQTLDMASGFLRAFNAAMRAGNAEMMAGLAVVVATPLAEVPAALRPVLIADIRKRHTMMPAGREISHRMQRYMERALMQARLYLMGDPGARMEFEIVAGQYAERHAIRRSLFASHLESFEDDSRTLPGALEWCERLITKFTPSEVSRRGLGSVANRLIAMASGLGDRPNEQAVLIAMAAYLSPEVGLTQNAAERVRRAVQTLNGSPEPEAIASDYAYQFIRARKAASG